jgi:hypothetical protein
MTNTKPSINKASSNLRWVSPFLIASWIIWSFGYQTVWQRLTIQVEGTVISRSDVPETGAPRYATYYVIHGDDGVDRAYVAGATDASLARSLPVGSHIRKEWGELGYETNSRWIAFPTIFYATALAGAGFLLILAGRLWWDDRSRNSEGDIR